MWWVLLFLGIALGGLTVLVALAVRVWRRLRTLLEEVGRAGDRTAELFDLLAQIRIETRGSDDELKAQDDPAATVRT